MKFYWVKTHRLIKQLFKGFVWDFKTSEKIVYLTFDDGPTPEITDWTLTLLKKFNAKATFFCIGENIAANPEIFKTIQLEGHSIGNHTNNHKNGWYCSAEEYLENVDLCDEMIHKNLLETTIEQKLFRPPYGKIKRKQIKLLKQRGYKIVMWDVLSADFDTTVKPQKCAENVLKNVKSGSIIIFHDSIKASKNLQYALPQTLEYLKKNNFKMNAIRFAPEPTK